jgi:hypothetical protein
MAVEHTRPVTDDATGHLSEGTMNFGQLFVDLLAEQVRHNLEVAAVLGQSVGWGEIARVQGEFLHASLDRWGRLNGGYFEIVQSAAWTAPSTSFRSD